MSMETIERKRDFLSPADHDWLASYDIDTDSPEFDRMAPELEEVIASGSIHLVPGGHDERFDQVIDARERFLKFLGFSEEELNEFRGDMPSLIPVDTFIDGQRAMAESGLDGKKMVTSFPPAMALGADAIRHRITTFTEEGVNGAKVLNAYPRTIGIAPDTISAKMRHLSGHGLDAQRIVTNSPTVIFQSPETMSRKLALLEELGIDPAHAVNKIPSLLGLAESALRDKIANLEKLGLDTKAVIHQAPGVLCLAPETVTENMRRLSLHGFDAVAVVNKGSTLLSLSPDTVDEKMRMLERSAKVLQWEFTAQDLVELYPPVIGFSTKKMAILRRIAAEKFVPEMREIDPKRARSLLIRPLEKYVVAIDMLDDEEMERLPRKVNSMRMPAAERKEAALESALSGRLGRVGAMYLDYRGVEATLAVSD